jgi:hypothetical protein
LTSDNNKSALYPLVVFSLMLSVFGPISTISFAQTVDNNDNNESLLPTIHIIKPTYCTSSISPGKVFVQGNANSSDGIAKVEAFAHGYPFNEEYPFIPAEPVSPGNWSSWSITLDLNTTGSHRILAKATDNSGRENWAEVILNVVAPVNSTGQSKEFNSTLQDKVNSSISLPSDQQPPTKKRIAFVDPTFTDAAYTADGFYDFYFKYNDVPKGVNVTTDLNFMTANLPEELDRGYIAPLVEAVINSHPDAEISIIRDQDVHNGALLNEDGSNAYDALILLHQEYVTQENYNSFKNFVKNGGTIIFLDPNIFYAEVTYDEDTCSVTLVKGHDWEYDGKAVRKGPAERYLEENKEWMGSNFVVRDIKDPVVFGNNPFNYTHFEENYVNNPHAKILLNYNATIKNTLGEESSPPPPSTIEVLNQLVPRGILNNLIGKNNQGEYLAEEHKTDTEATKNKTIATYELQYGQGKVLMLGIYGQNLANNTSFQNFFNNIILTRAIGVPGKAVIDGKNDNIALTLGTAYSVNPDKDSNSDNNNGTTVYSKMNFGMVDKAFIEPHSKTLKVILNRSESVPDSLVLVLPKLLIDTHNTTASGKIDANFTVAVDGSPSMYNQVSDDVETAFVIPLSPSSKVVEISSTHAMPKFSILQISHGWQNSPAS